MRVLSVFLLFSVVAVCQTVSGRQPGVAWKRQMAPFRGSPLQNTPEPPEVSTPVLKVPALVHVTPEIPVPAAPPIAEPQPARTRAEIMKGLEVLQNGATRREVFATLGQPSYSIGMPDAGHYVERCRFRSGGEDLAVIELRDGRVTAILGM